MKHYKFILSLILLLILTGCLSKPTPGHLTVDEMLESKIYQLTSACMHAQYNQIPSLTYNQSLNWENIIETRYQNTTIMKISYTLTKSQDRSAWTDTFIPAAQFEGDIHYEDGSRGTCSNVVEFTKTEDWKINLGKWLADNK